MGAQKLLAIPTLEYERRVLDLGYTCIAGVDEAGRGSWAGPVVAAAVILPITHADITRSLAGVRDSKLLSSAQRGRLLGSILDNSLCIGIGWATRRDIDEMGIATANRKAMLHAVRRCRQRPDALLIDHFAVPECPLPQWSITHGDSLSLSIAAASIVAKEVRDRWMVRCARRFPEYGFAHHKGYGTALHRKALAEHGPCPLHRRSFTPIRAALR